MGREGWGLSQRNKGNKGDEGVVKKRTTISSSPIETKGGRGRKRENSKFCREENLKQTNKQNAQSQLNSSNGQHITVSIVRK